MVTKTDRPGYKQKHNKDGSAREYWMARDDLVARGFEPKLVRLHYDQTPPDRQRLAARCKILQAEMLAWAAGEGRTSGRPYDGTIGSLSRLFEADEYSPFRRMKWNSQVNIGKSIKVIVATVGARQIGRLLGPDFYRWHAKWGEPKAEGAKPRPWRAKHAMDVIRQIVAYGVTLGFEDCFRADTILGKLRFETPLARTAKLTIEHVEAIRTAAREMGRSSIALATVLQFELSLRQKDVIGEWEPAPLTEGGIVYRGRRWVSGLTWSNIDSNFILRKVTTKRGVEVEHDLTLSPMVMMELGIVPRAKRVGPMIIDESTGQPYKNVRFTDVWRKVANRAGVPSTVQNMDARAGAISEIYDAGVSQTDAMKHAGHQDPRMSAHYNRGSLEQTRRAALQRQKKRGRNADEGRGGDV